MRLILLGASGAGKGTQAQRLSAHFQIPWIGTGDLLRAAIRENSELGQQAQAYVEQGELVPDELMIQFIQSRLQLPDASNGWILDGYPRTAFQAEELDFLLEALDQPLDQAILLDVPESVLVERSLQRALPDDQPEVVQRRIQLFEERTLPLLDYYRYRQRLQVVPGAQPPEPVFAQILSVLTKKQPN